MLEKERPQHLDKSYIPDVSPLTCDFIPLFSYFADLRYRLEMNLSFVYFFNPNRMPCFLRISVRAVLMRCYVFVHNVVLKKEKKKKTKSGQSSIFGSALL